MSFFVTLPSHSSIKEFPDNHASSFKVRLPQPLRLLGDGWQVGLSAISLPDTHMDLTPMAELTEALIGMTCYIIKSGTTRLETVNLVLKTLQENGFVIDGVSFMKVALNWIYKQFAERSWGYWGYTKKDNNKDTCLVWTWDGEDLVLDNKNLARKKICGSRHVFSLCGV